MALVGTFLVYARGDSFFGLSTVPAFDPGNKALRHNVEELDGAVATIILVLAGFQATAALIHHYVARRGLAAHVARGVLTV
jgi:cytochrome b561